MNKQQPSIVLVSRKEAFVPGRADLALIASGAGWRVSDVSWDSDNGAPCVAAFEADFVGIVLAGAVPVIEDETLEALFLRQGFRVVKVPALREPNNVGETVPWVHFACAMPTGKEPLPASAAVSFDELKPGEVLSLFERAR